MIGDPIVMVECDTCGSVEEHSMTPLATKSWDTRYLIKELKRGGWVIRDDETTICPDCVAMSEEE